MSESFWLGREENLKDSPGGGHLYVEEKIKIFSSTLLSTFGQQERLDLTCCVSPPEKNLDSSLLLSLSLRDTILTLPSPQESQR